MATLSLTPAVLSKAYPSGVESAVYDREIPGYHLRVTKAGKRLLYLYYRSPVERGQQRKARIGELGAAVTMPDGTTATLTAFSGRKLARALKGVVEAGRDPVLELRDSQVQQARALEVAREAAKGARLVADVVRDFLADAEARARSPKTVREWARLLRKHVVPVIGQRPIAEVDRADADRVRAAMPRGRRILANRVQQVCCALLNFAADVRGTLANPFVAGRQGKNRWYREEMTRQPITRDELRALFRELDAELESSRGGAADAIRLLALTGWRKNEVLALRWDAVDRGSGLVALARTKTGRSDRALSPAALDLLSEIPQRGAYVFPSPSNTDAPRTEVKRTWLRVRARAGVAKPMHALRHAAATIALSEGVPLAAVGAMLGHRDPKTTLRYAKVEQAAALEAAATLGRAIGSFRQAADVVPIARARKRSA